VTSYLGDFLVLLIFLLLQNCAQESGIFRNFLKTDLRSMGKPIDIIVAASSEQL